MATAQLPRVRLTAVFAQDLAAAGKPPQAFADGFAAWKASGVPGALKDPYFGKDGPYARPTLASGKTALWHVHLRPEGDPAAVLEWDRRTRLGIHKNSDAVLIYTHDLAHGFLLIHAVWDNGAHDLARGSTPAAVRAMRSFLQIAEEFILLGTISV